MSADVAAAKSGAACNSALASQLQEGGHACHGLQQQKEAACEAGEVDLACQVHAPLHTWEQLCADACASAPHRFHEPVVERSKKASTQHMLHGL